MNFSMTWKETCKRHFVKTIWQLAHLLRSVDDPSIVTELEHSEHRGEYAVRQKESQALETESFISWEEKTKRMGLNNKEGSILPIIIFLIMMNLL